MDGMVLGGLHRHFVGPEVDAQLGAAHAVSPVALDRALAAHPGAVAAYVVTPSYFGAVADVRGLADTPHARGVVLVVDEAWCAHGAFGGVHDGRPYGRGGISGHEARQLLLDRHQVHTEMATDSVLPAVIGPALCPTCRRGNASRRRRATSCD